ncbi:MAG: LytTR family DNA-binding domain-containing protein, partial [Bacteroidota bacterium]
QALKPDLVFLDIQIGSQTIFELLHKLDSLNFEIIFVSAYEHFALKAFQFMASDYLLKPIDIPKLQAAVEKASTNVNNRSIHTHLQQMMLNLQSIHQEQHKIALATLDGYELVYVRSIIYCLADGSYTHVHFNDGSKLTVSRNLKHYERMLSEYGFMRVHQSALINLRLIRKVVRASGGSLVMEDGHHVPISKSKRMELEEAIKANRRLI